MFYSGHICAFHTIETNDIVISILRIWFSSNILSPVLAPKTYRPFSWSAPSSGHASPTMHTMVGNILVAHTREGVKNICVELDHKGGNPPFIELILLPTKFAYYTLTTLVTQCAHWWEIMATPKWERNARSQATIVSQARLFPPPGMQPSSAIASFT